MALLNYSALYSNINSYLNATTGSSDWLKIFVSPDSTGGGHLITHGIDFGASYINGLRGLVPTNSLTLNKSFLRGDGWSALWSAADEIASAIGDTDAQLLAAKELYLQTTLASAYDIKQWIAQAFVANNAMRFSGKINIDGTGAITTTTENGTINGFPTLCQVGDTYKVDGTSIDANSYIAGEPVSTGDMVICIKSGSGADLNDPQYWTIVQDNVEHLITYTLNGTAFRLYAQTPNNITIYAPITPGTQGQVLISKGTGLAPEWINQALLVVAEAAKVTNALSKGTGITMTYQGTQVSSYNGSEAVIISLSPATATTIGGVIIDNGTNSEKYNQPANTSLTPYPTISVDSNGQIYLTKANIVNALGYDPISALPIFTDSLDGLVPMASLANKQTNDVDNVIQATTFVLGADAKWYKLPASAFVSDKRIIKLGGTTVIDSDVSTALNIIAGSHISILAELVDNQYTGNMTFSAIWRDIQLRVVSGTSISNTVESIGDNSPLVFDNSESVFTLGEEVTVGSTTKTVVKSYITWYNMDTGEYEII